MYKWRRNASGFTLVELMIVILILGILVAIAVPIYLAAMSNARLRACQANLRTIDGAEAQFRSLYEAPATDVAALHAYFLKDKPPGCPSGSGSYVFDASNDASCANAPDHKYP